VFFGALGQFPGRADSFQDFFGALAHGDIELAGPDLGEVGGHAALVVADGHLIVIEDHQHIGPFVPRVSQGLEGHAAGDGAVAYHGDNFARYALLPGGQRHAHRGGDAGGGVADAKGVVLALGALGESRQPAGLSHAMHLLHAAGEDFMGIGLVAHVPYDTVKGGVVDMV